MTFKLKLKSYLKVAGDLEQLNLSEQEHVRVKPSPQNYTAVP